ncbi:thermopsin family protease [Sulfuracidifex tepidarius]|uniref:Thermopsin n=1 Tax=Sulfuracidifex tepidarius TaxID=1294262 RepID=A0A510DZL8_9CREN|nr:thermopsin family protease [Sulfuracidifex tepidarius]BBG25619.1 Thermopsin [Sulfuracidifex tepidarius]
MYSLKFMKWGFLVFLSLIFAQVSMASINPYVDTQEYPFHSYAIGIASYGVYQKGNSMIPYFIKTDSVVGFVRVDSVNSENPFSIQLNVMLIVNDQTFWLQDVVVMNPSEDQFYLSSSVLNLTSLDSPLHNVSGDGSFIQGSDGQCYYVNYIGNYYYSLPFSFLPIINVTHSTSEVRILFGFKGIEGNCFDGKTVFFDNVVIHFPYVYRASIYVSGYNYLSDSSPYQGFSFYDAELVFGGEGNGKVVSFNQLEAFLSLYYQKDGKYVSFPSYFDFGSDTAEGTSNLVTHRVGNLFEVTTGRQSYYYLGRGEGSISVDGGKTLVVQNTISPIQSVILSFLLFILILASIFRKIISSI